MSTTRHIVDPERRCDELLAESEAILAASPPDMTDADLARIRANHDEFFRLQPGPVLNSRSDLAGKLAVRGALTAESTSEQAGAGLDRCSPAEFAEFQSLNAAYKARFGFPFILAVKGYDRAGILAAFRRRVTNPRAREFREALDQVHRIALLRLLALAAG